VDNIFHDVWKSISQLHDQVFSLKDILEKKYPTEKKVASKTGILLATTL